MLGKLLLFHAAEKQNKIETPAMHLVRKLASILKQHETFQYRISCNMFLHGCVEAACQQIFPPPFLPQPSFSPLLIVK